MSDVSVGHSDEQVGCKGNCHSLGEWRHLVSYQVAQFRTGGHSDMMVGLVLTGSDALEEIWGLNSLQTDREGHKGVIHHVW